MISNSYEHFRLYFHDKLHNHYNKRLNIPQLKYWKILTKQHCLTKGYQFDTDLCISKAKNCIKYLWELCLLQISLILYCSVWLFMAVGTPACLSEHLCVLCSFLATYFKRLLMLIDYFQITLIVEVSIFWNDPVTLRWEYRFVSYCTYSFYVNEKHIIPYFVCKSCAWSLLNIFYTKKNFFVYCGDNYTYSLLTKHENSLRKHKNRY